MFTQLSRLLLTLALAATTLPALSQAQKFPAKPVRIIVGAPPGTAPDVVLRLLTSRFNDVLGVAGIVDNRPGGGGMIAINAVAGSPSDGHTLLMADTAMYAVGPHQNADNDPLRLLQPVMLAGISPLFFAVSNNSNATNLKDFIAYAKGNPGLPYGSSGQSSAHHLFMELLKARAGLQMNHIPYKGAAGAIAALVSGDVAAVFSANLLFPLAKAGKLRILAVAADRRLAITPDIPTFAEAGFSGFDVSPVTYGVFAPLNSPANFPRIRDNPAFGALRDWHARIAARPAVQRGIAATAP